MPTQKEIMQVELAAINARAKEKGINVDDLRRETRDESALAGQLITLINTTSPTLRRERIILEMPPEGQPAGAFDGTNQDFPVRGPVFGRNLIVLHVVNATGSVVELSRTSSPAPAAGSFWFDDATLIRVGTPPQASDMLAAIYITE